MKGGCGVDIDYCSRRLAYCAFQIYTCSSRIAELVPSWGAERRVAACTFPVIAVKLRC